MDINKWKSVAVRIDDYKILKTLAETKFRAPASMISKLVNDYVKVQAKKQRTTPEKFVKKLLNGNHDK